MGDMYLLETLAQLPIHISEFYGQLDVNVIQVCANTLVMTLNSAMSKRLYANGYTTMEFSANVSVILNKEQKRIDVIFDVFDNCVIHANSNIVNKEQMS